MERNREKEVGKWGVRKREREREICPCLDTLLGREEEGGKEREREREREKGERNGEADEDGHTH